MKTGKGFTLTELILVMALFAIIASFASINLLRPQTQASLDATVATLAADLKQQQIKAMSGDSQGDSEPREHGVLFSSGSYTLFKGTQAGVDDFVVNVASVTLSTTLPSSEVVFSKRSGEIMDFIPGSNTVTVTNNAGQSKVITINQYGVVNY